MQKKLPYILTSYLHVPIISVSHATPVVITTLCLGVYTSMTVADGFTEQ